MPTLSIQGSVDSLALRDAAGDSLRSVDAVTSAVAVAVEGDPIVLTVHDAALRRLLEQVATGRVRVDAGAPGEVRASSPRGGTGWKSSAYGLETALRDVENQHWYELASPGARQDAIRRAREAGASDDQVRLRIERGAAIAAHRARVLQLAEQRGADAQETQQAKSELLAEFPYLERHIEGRLDYRRHNERARADARAAALAHGTPSSVRAGNEPHALSRLAPAPTWTVVVDEGGSIEREGDRAVFVAVAVPEGASLPPVEAGWHAVHAPIAEIDRVVQALLDAPNVGVFGLSRASLPKDTLDPWLHGVLSLVRWVIRLLPIDGPTKVRVLVEQRGEHRADRDWSVGFKRVHGELADVDPARAANLLLDLALIKKTDSELNAYADALAATWVSKLSHAVARRQQSGLLHGCLHFDDLRPVARAFDEQVRTGELSGDAWRTLLDRRDARVNGSPTRVVLDRAKAACTSAERIAPYVDAVRQHLDGKAIDLPRAHHEIRWLREAAREELQLTSVTRLLLRTAELEEANHRGVVDDALEAELRALAGELFDEVPTLVCQAELSLAVRATNRFDFDGASRWLTRWIDQPVAVPGLRHAGRVLSSLGQHRAFRGEHAEADVLFAEALRLFARLSDPHVAYLEAQQTSCYRAIAAMDDPARPDDEVRALVAAVARLDPVSIAELSADTTAKRQYAHHVLVRYLVARGTDAERAAYLGARRRWDAGFEHPWPLILGYRALLVRPLDAAEAERHLVDAVSHARLCLQGPLVAFLGEVLATIGRRWGVNVPSSSREERSALRKQLPNAPWDRLDELLAAGASEREILERTLPFNFR